MYKKLSVAAGIILLVGGLSYIAFYRSQVNQLVALDSKDFNVGGGGGGDGGGGGGSAENFGCGILKSPELSRRLLAEQETTVLSLTVRPNQGCYVSLQAPENFTVSPTRREYSFEASDNRIGQEIPIGWVLSPQKSGNFDISVSAGSSTEVLRLRATDVFGLSPWQTKIASEIIAFIGGGITLKETLNFIKKSKNTNQDK